MQEVGDHKQNYERIAKNAFILYVRMFFALIVSLYTVRIVLHALGDKQYGAYVAVSGVIGMLSVIHSFMSGAASRFLTYELGVGDKEKLRATFSTSFLTLLGIGGIIILLGETVGLWYIVNILNIPVELRTPVLWVYQLSLFTVFVNVLQVPYDSLIIAHERMNVYAYIEIANIVMKLLIVYLLMVLPFDKLITYATLVFLEVSFIAFLYKTYCNHNFPESTGRLSFNKKIFKPMMSFSMFGGMCAVSSTARYQGSDLLANRFFGVMINAPMGLATSLSGMLWTFSNNVITAFRPQIVKNYATNDFNEMMTLMQYAMKIVSLLFFAIGVPLIFDIDDILNLWLEKVPAYTPLFCKLTIIQVCCGAFSCIPEVGIDATGQKKLNGIVISLCNIMVVPIIYCFYKLGFLAESAYLVQIAVNVVLVIGNYVILNRLIPQIKFTVMMKNLFMLLLHLCICLIPVMIVIHWVSGSILRLFINFLVFNVFSFIVAYIYLLSQNDRERIKQLAKRLLLRRKVISLL